METLTFIGLANYKPSTNYLVNIIFTSTGSEKTTYQYNFSSQSALPTTNWKNIPTLIDVTIPTNREISAQLDSGNDTANINYYLFIRASNSINTIWLQSATNVTKNTIINNLISNYTTNLLTTTVNCGSINTITSQSISTYSITNNIIYTSNTNITIINIPVIYNQTNGPIFIMSDYPLTIANSLTSTLNSSSINIVGTSTGTINYGIKIGAAITITGNITLNGKGTGTDCNGIYINSAVILSGNVTLNGTGNGTQFGYGIRIIKESIIKDSVILNGLATGTTAWGISLEGTGIITIEGNVRLNGTGNGTQFGYGIKIVKESSIKDSVILIGLATGNTANGILIEGTGIITIEGSVKLNGLATGITGSGIYINGTLTITGAVIFIITITNSTLPYIKKNSGTLSGLINIIINPSSNLAVPGNYNLFQNISANNIGTMTGLFNTIRWNIIPTSVNNWALVTVASKLNGVICGRNIVIDDKYYILLPNGNIIQQYIKLYNVTSILEIQSILVTSSKNGTILYISDDNIVKVIANGLYGITSIMQDNNKNIYYTIIRNKLFYIYKLGENGNTNTLILQGQGENIEIFYSFGNIIVVNTDTNIISIYKFLYDIKLEFIYKKDVSNLGIITNIINNNGTLLFLFNNNTIYKFNTFNMVNILYTNISYTGIALSNNTLYGIIDNGEILYSEKLLSNYIIS